MHLQMVHKLARLRRRCKAALFNQTACGRVPVKGGMKSLDAELTMVLQGPDTLVRS